MPLGVVIEKRKVDHKWIDWAWKPVAIIPGAGPVEDWKEIASGDGWTHYHADTLTLTLYRSDTEAYQVNLVDSQPSIYAVLRENDDDTDGSRPYRAHMVTASPFEAQDFEDTGEDIIERIPMTEALFAWVQAFVEEHHVDVEFVKRKRREVRNEPEKFGKEPIFRDKRKSSVQGSDKEH